MVRHRRIPIVKTSPKIEREEEVRVTKICSKTFDSFAMLGLAIKIAPFLRHEGQYRRRYGGPRKERSQIL